jgi:hypothetical protein
MPDSLVVLSRQTVLCREIVCCEVCAESKPPFAECIKHSANRGFP